MGALDIQLLEYLSPLKGPLLKYPLIEVEVSLSCLLDEGEYVVW